MKHDNYYGKTLDTPVGEMVLATTDAAVVALVWTPQAGRLGLPPFEEGRSCALLQEAEGQLGEYFRGGRTAFDLPLEPRGTDFQRRVWTELAKIPYGVTWSYQELARRAGSPGAVRAAGSANGRNPLCIFLPCHRVVRLSGELGGYAGGLGHKAFLLELERSAVGAATSAVV